MVEHVDVVHAVGGGAAAEYILHEAVAEVLRFVAAGVGDRLGFEATATAGWHRVDNLDEPELLEFVDGFVSFVGEADVTPPQLFGQEDSAAIVGLGSVVVRPVGLVSCRQEGGQMGGWKDQVPAAGEELQR